MAKQCPSFLQVFANAAKQYLTADVAAGARTGSSGSTAVRSALRQRRNFYAGNLNLRGDASQQVRLLWPKDTNNCLTSSNCLKRRVLTMQLRVR